MRRTATLAVLIAGVALAVVSYFFLTAGWGTSGEEFSNPRLQFAPLIFIIGLLAIFGSAVVYELIPNQADDDEP